jgi:hypothetical protein
MSPAPQDGPAARRWTIPTVLAILVVCAALTSGLLTTCLRARPGDIIPTPGSGNGDSWSTAPLPPQLFKTWPSGKKPDVALILSGQQHSYLKFCGCSSPQLGGFERRFNFMAKLKERGWPLVAADLGDLVQFKSGLHDQALLKYETAMQALEILNYSAIGLGADDFALPLLAGMSRFTLQKPDAFPRVLTANLDPTYRSANFPHPNDPNKSMIGDWIPVQVKGAPKVGIAGLIGAAVIKQIQAADQNVRFANNGAVVAALQQAMTADKVELKVLLFQGPASAAPAIAQQFPGAFDVILTQSEEDTPPAQADVVGTTTIVRVGHRGRWIGVIGAYRTANPARPFELYFETVPLGEEYETAKGKEANHPILKLLDGYAEQVKAQDFLKRTPQAPVPVPASLGNVKLSFVGSQACATCHAADFARWQKSKHEHAFDALTKVASKPALRQHDPECVSCHVTGFGLKGGYDGAMATRQFRNVNCENCHGPGSAHVAAPANPAFRLAMSPWKGTNPNALLPTPTTMQKGVGAMNQVEKDVYLRVIDMCQKCHDLDNDPNFKIDTFWPKIIHGKNANAPIPPLAQK